MVFFVVGWMKPPILRIWKKQRKGIRKAGISGRGFVSFAFLKFLPSSFKKGIRPTRGFPALRRAPLDAPGDGINTGAR